MLAKIVAKASNWRTILSLAFFAILATSSLSILIYRNQTIENTNALAFNFTDNLATSTYINTGSTTAFWDSANSQYTLPHDAIGWKSMDSLSGYDDLSLGTGMASNHQVVIAPNGTPYAVWQDLTTGNSDIYFAYWSGSEWTGLASTSEPYDNISANFGISIYPFLAVSSSNTPYILWADDSNVRVSTFSNNGWHGLASTSEPYDTLAINQYNSYSQRNNIVIDSNDKIYVHYSNSSQTRLTAWDGSAWKGLVNTSASYDIVGDDYGNVKIKIDSSNTPYIVGTKSINGYSDIFISTFTGGIWTGLASTTSSFDNLSNNAANNNYFDFYISKNNKLYVTWSDNALGYYAQYVTSFNGTDWTGLKNTGNPYDHVLSDGIFYAPRIIAPLNEQPYVFNNNGTKLLSHWSGADWTGLASTSQPSDSASFINFFLDNNDIFYKTYICGTSNTDVCLAYWNSSSWTGLTNAGSAYDNLSLKTGVPNSSLSSDAGLVFSADNTLYAHWLEKPSLVNHVYFSRFDPALYYPTDKKIYSQKINDISTGLPVSSATLSVGSSLPASTSINYYLSNDGGLNWATTTQGVELFFSSTGYDLRWRADLFTADQSQTPVIDSVSVDYKASAVVQTPALVSPAANYSSADSVTLVATFNDQNISNTGKIDFEIATNDFFTFNVATGSSASGLAVGVNGSKQFTGLKQGVTYYWRARAQNSVGEISSWSTSRAFTVTCDHLFCENFITTTYRSVLTEESVWSGDGLSKKISGLEPHFGGLVNNIVPYDNVSVSNGSSYSPEIATLASGTSYVVWTDETTGSGDIYFAQWNGSVWTGLANPGMPYDNLSANAGTSSSAQIFAYSDSKIYVVWADETIGNSEIYLSFWNGTSWSGLINASSSYDNLSVNSGNSRNPQLEVVSAGRPVISTPYVSWEDDSTGNFDIYIATINSGSWTGLASTSLPYDNVSANTEASYNSRIKVSSGGESYLSWQDFSNGNYDIMVSSWNGNSWTGLANTGAVYDNISLNSGPSFSPQIDIFANGELAISWTDGTAGNNDIYFSVWNGITWAGLASTSSAYDNLSANSGDSNSVKIKIASNTPYLTWQDDTVGNSEIFFTHWNGSAWRGLASSSEPFDNLSLNSGTSRAASIAASVSGELYAVWQDNSSGNYDVYLTAWDEAKWAGLASTTATNDNLSSNSGLSAQPRIIIATGSLPYVVWQDQTSGISDIYLAAWSNQIVGANSGVAISNRVSTSSQNVVAATINAVTTAGTVANYYLSNDGGSNWEQALLGQSYGFSSTSNDLRFKLEIANGSVSGIYLDWIESTASVVGSTTITNITNVTNNTSSGGGASPEMVNSIIDSYYKKLIVATTSTSTTTGGAVATSVISSVIATSVAVMPDKPAGEIKTTPEKINVTSDGQGDAVAETSISKKITDLVNGLENANNKIVILESILNTKMFTLEKTIVEVNGRLEKLKNQEEFLDQYVSDSATSTNIPGVESKIAESDNFFDRMSGLIDGFGIADSALWQNTKQGIRKVQSNPTAVGIAEKIAEPITQTVAVGAAAVGAAAILSSGIGAQALMAINQFAGQIGQFINLSALVSAFGIRRRRRWGVVRDFTSKKPVSGVAIHLIKKPFDKLIETQMTDQHGRFSFVVNQEDNLVEKTGNSKEEYYLKISKDGYRIYTHLDSSQNIYHGQSFKAVDLNEQNLNFEIYLVGVGDNLPEINKGKLIVFNVLKFLEHLSAKLGPYFLFLGTLLGLLVLIVVPNSINSAVLIFYLILDLAQFLATKLTIRSAGIVSGSAGESIGLAIVRLFDKKTGRLLGTKVTSNNGKFNFLLLKGSYYLTVTAEHYHEFISKTIIAKTEDVVNLEVKLKKI